jgi:hypothetical protein
MTPAWLTDAANALLERIAEQRYELNRRMDNPELCSADRAAGCAAVAAWYAREACVWRVLSQHTNDLLAIHAMCGASFYAKDSAREFRQLAEFWRGREDAPETTKTAGGAA